LKQTDLSLLNRERPFAVEYNILLSISENR